MKKKDLIIFIFLIFNISCASIYSNNLTNKINTNYFDNLNLLDIDNSLYFNISKKYSPSIGQNDRIKFLIIHYTGSDYFGSLTVLTKENVSAHYLIPDNSDSKDIQLLVSEDKRAWHAGISKWGKFNNLNDISIGIEFVNKGFLSIDGKKKFFDFTDSQYKKMIYLCKIIIPKYKIKPNYILGHADIAPTRKHDPGPKFPWKRLYEEYNIGAWYNEKDKNFFLKIIEKIKFDSSEILKIQKEFEKYGYDIKVNGILDSSFKNIVTVFQYHFRPSNYDGNIDKETYAILLSLNKKYN